MNDQLNQFRTGYACLNLDTPMTYRTCRQSNLTLEKWQELIAWNLNTLKGMILYNLELKIPLYRISSDLIPFGSAEVLEYDWASDFKAEFQELKALLSKGIRFSMHPGQYTVLNSPDPKVVTNAIRDLEYHAKVLALLGATQVNKLVLHIGGVYGDKVEATRRFIQTANALDPSIRKHLILENDERLYNIQDVLDISRATGLPAIFDNLHHVINSPAEDLPLAEWILKAGETWKEADGRQIIHYSQQSLEKRRGAHSVSAGTKEFLQFLRSLKRPLDIMLEIKDKNRSAEKLQMVLAHDIALAERLWARHKYSILARSQPLYREIRSILKDKDGADLEHLARLFDRSRGLPYSPGDAVNAAEHVWGYFKKVASEAEKQRFRSLIEGGLPEPADETAVRAYLKRMLKKYPDPYLKESYYFNESPV